MQNLIEPPPSTPPQNVKTHWERGEEAIASAWFQALVDLDGVVRNPGHSRDGLPQLTRQILALLSDEPYQPAMARAIGARFALPGAKHVDGLAALQPILYQALTQGLEPDQMLSISTRLGRVFIDLTAGLVEQQSNDILLEHEQALQAYETEWKRFIADRQEMEQKSQAILRALPDAVSIITLDGVVLYYHSGSDQRYPNEEELPFKNIRTYLTAAVADDLLAIYHTTIETGRHRTYEYSVTRQNGDKRYFQDNITPYLGNSVLVISRDVTRQKQIEDELRASQIRYRNVVEDQEELIARWTPDGTLIFINNAVCTFMGKDYDQLINTSFNEILKPANAMEAQKLYAAHGALTPANAFAQGQSQVRAQNNDPRWLEWKTRAFFDESRRLIEFQTTASDVTEIKRIQDALQESEARYRSVVETQAEIIGRFKPDGTITFVNTAAQRLFGFPAAAMIGHSIVEFAHLLGVDLAQRIPYLAGRLNLQNPTTRREVTVNRTDGKPIRLDISTQAIFNAQGEVVEFQTTGSDVTDLRQMEAALRESESRYRDMVEGQTELITRYLLDGTVTFVNDAYCNFFAKTRQELLGHSVLEYIDQTDQPRWLENLENIKKLRPENPFLHGQTHVIAANHELRWIEWTTRVIFRPDGIATECQSVGRDITDLIQAQEALEQQNELLLQLSELSINAQETERQRIALDLHDSVLNELGVMLISPPEMFTPKMVRDNYERLIDRLRETINGLRSPMLNYGLHAALEDLFDHLLDSPLAEGVLTMEIPPSQVRFDPHVELHLFRIIQQACENALQHAQAKSIRIYGLIVEKYIEIIVEDDGVGFPLGYEPDLAHILAQKHFGLVSMLERGKLIGADVQISSNPGAGTKVRVLWEPGYSWT
jgi:PAS domain S-box-containing protein